MLRNKPRLKGSEEQRSGDAAKESANHQHPVVGPMLSDTAQDVSDHIGERSVLPTTERRYKQWLVEAAHG